jgi:hypothetical protein
VRPFHDELANGTVPGAHLCCSNRPWRTRELFACFIDEQSLDRVDADDELKLDVLQGFRFYGNALLDRSIHPVLLAGAGRTGGTRFPILQRCKGPMELTTLTKSQSSSMPSSRTTTRASARPTVVSSPVIRDSPAEFMTGIVSSTIRKLIRPRRGVQRWVIGMTPLIAEPVILRVVSLIERVKQRLETSDGRPLWEVTCGHNGQPYLTLNSGRKMVCAVAGAAGNAP